MIDNIFQIANNFNLFLDKNGGGFTSFLEIYNSNTSIYRYSLHIYAR
jgi:hypothetical protein